MNDDKGQTSQGLTRNMVLKIARFTWLWKGSILTFDCISNVTIIKFNNNIPKKERKLFVMQIWNNFIDLHSHLHQFESRMYLLTSVEWRAESSPFISILLHLQRYSARRDAMIDCKETNQYPYASNFWYITIAL